MTRDGPYSAINFLVEVDGLEIAGFSRCRLGEARTRVLQYREGTFQDGPRLLPAEHSWGPLRLERGVGDTTALFEWRTAVEDGDMARARRNATVVLLDEAMNPAGPRWEFRDAWPARYVGPTLDAHRGTVAIEALEIVHEGFVRE